MLHRKRGKDLERERGQGREKGWSEAGAADRHLARSAIEKL